MNIVYFGSGEFGVPTLARLHAADSSHRLLAVVTQPDRPAGRGAALTPTPVAQWAAAHAPGVPVIKPERVGDPDVIRHIRALSPGGGAPTAFVVIAFGQKIPAALIVDRFAINLHASLLPRWRGAAPINAAILAGDDVTGNSVITLAERMDAGLILGQTRRAIDEEHTAGELHDLLAADGPELVLRVLSEYASGALAPITQDESAVTKAPKLHKRDGVLDWSEPAEASRRRVHALTPWPGVAVRLGEAQVKLLRVRALSDAERSSGRHDAGDQPGTLVDPDAGLVACAGGTILQLRSVHPAGKRAMEWTDFVRGHKIAKGTLLTSPIPISPLPGHSFPGHSFPPTSSTA